ncbi:MAG: hypothetical protein ACREVF_08220 [Burkholderiales bacterium]
MSTSMLYELIEWGTAALNAALEHDFAAEWNESLRVKDHRPLGEDEIRRLLNAKSS